MKRLTHGAPCCFLQQFPRDRTSGQKYQRDAIRITTLAEKSQHTDIEYQAIKVGKHDGENAIINVCAITKRPVRLSLQIPVPPLDA